MRGADNDGPIPHAPVPARLSPPPNPPSVLIADDNPEVRSFLCDMIKTMGADVHEAENGTRALELVFALQPDLVLLDIEMPGCDGFSVCRQLKQDPRTFRIPVIIVTSLSVLEDRVRGIESGADDFLTKPVRIQELLARATSLLKLKRLYDSLESAENVIFSLARAIEAKDAYTQGHTERVTDYAVRLGTALHLNPDELLILRQGATLHDIGKIGVPDQILNKPAKLNNEEFELIRRHPILGYEICSPLKSLSKTLPCIRWHHERPNGKGYPDGLSGAQIPRLASVLAIADVYDALTTERSYKPAFSSAKAISILREEARTGGLNAELADLFIESVIPHLGTGRPGAEGSRMPLSDNGERSS